MKKVDKFIPLASNNQEKSKFIDKRVLNNENYCNNKYKIIV